MKDPYKIAPVAGVFHDLRTAGECDAVNAAVECGWFWPRAAELAELGYPAEEVASMALDGFSIDAPAREATPTEEMYQRQEAALRECLRIAGRGLQRIAHRLGCAATVPAILATIESTSTTPWRAVTPDEPPAGMPVLGFIPGRWMPQMLMWRWDGQWQAEAQPGEPTHWMPLPSAPAAPSAPAVQPPAVQGPEEIAADVEHLRAPPVREPAKEDPAP